MKKMIEERHEDLVLRTYTLFMEIAQAANKYSDRHLQRSNHLKTATYVALQGLIADGGVMSHTKLADWTNTRKHNITTLVDRMEKQGLVTTERSTEDKRVVPVEITEKGRKLYEAAGSVAREMMTQIMRGFGREQSVELEKLLMIMKANIEGEPRESKQGYVR